MKTLENSSNEWVLDIVKAYISANAKSYNLCISKYAQNMKENAVLQTAKPSNILDEKIKLLSLVRLAFDKASFERIISFDEIRSVTQCKDNDVEHLVMKAMSLQLIKGIVDGIDKTVNVLWVKPAILDIKQMEAISEKIAVWIEKTQDAHSQLHEFEL